MLTPEEEQKVALLMQAANTDLNDGRTMVPTDVKIVSWLLLKLKETNDELKAMNKKHQEYVDMYSRKEHTPPIPISPCKREHCEVCGT